MSMKGVVVGLMCALLLVTVGRVLSIEGTVLLSVVTNVLACLLSRDETYYDLTGSATHLAVVVTSFLGAPATKRQVLASFAAAVWAARLGTFLFLRMAKDGRDSRFDKVRTKPIAFFAVWLIQALWVVVIELPVVLLNRVGGGGDDDDPPLGSLRDVAGFGLWVAGFALEVAADTQKFVFRCQHKDAFMRRGLWRYSRHPNFAGEILLWTGLALVATSATPESRAPWLSPAFTALILTKVSGIPPLEKSAEKRYGADPAFRHYVQHTSILVPWFPAPTTTTSTTTTPTKKE
eukprot:CAMPEP_0118896808 /NCGR_PEP_ID=MMETSP1166-20130328/4492_1 /TAXON_ID=1104430 /ORGANISM="Chrysoreinhardia sp, Strain CCMP3193" /LENGTH=290 /DNA_ID=CAMNT_0006835867 /DNA_START=128 /DNA_END=1000 /DNA_ORIENTATION=-